ncbi:DUF2384 domain-containing protein [Sphingobium sp. RSMS]|uniref:antitoxin Xre/MbcA/ParS toxin-binding domain-containing protein n=1 Tax=Sphingobium sp. RSMS TaxID=520734 RepID=UPI0010F6DEED|nr:antitoxin Xre/MbcA/ParS toxin-binding domain-containing protein [Sphingobium sp. RSMS]UXC90258.1 DUF2384 domain-containing protein [Sphingobium sp. RSMS]
MADKKIRQLGELLAEMTPESLHDEADFGPPVGNEAGSNQMIAKRIAQVLDFASSIYPDASKLVEFMRRRHPMLDGQSALDCAVSSDAEADRVIDLLGRAAYGGGV